ncbi:MAG TPA: pentapeptide repeat-containing protein [Sedimentisphaerales bacterium]|nr:pentapeptide repeat-containing protein [Sedimentisphaerales bacterium]
MDAEPIGEPNGAVEKDAEGETQRDAAEEAQTETSGEAQTEEVEEVRKRLRPREKYSAQQYQMLLACSASRDMTEWNRWREEHKQAEVLLEAAELKGVYLAGANLRGGWLKEADLREASLEGANFNGAHLEGAFLACAELKGAYFYHAHLEGAFLNNACLEGADLTGAFMAGAYVRRANLKGAKLEGSHAERADMLQARLEGAKLEDAHFQGTDLGNSYLEGAMMARAHLEDANLSGAHLEGADLTRAHLEHANLMYSHLRDAVVKYTHLERAFFVEAHLEGAHFEQAIVDGSTLLWHCHVDRHSDFRGVGLEGIRIDPGTKQLLEYNVRRMNWEAWYGGQPGFVRWLVKRFWRISDYGLSTIRIIKTFFKWTLLFAVIYYAWGFVDYYFVGIKDHPGIVSELFVLEGGGEAVSVYLVPFRAVYFSIVTMTTLGFGDMYANAHGFFRGLFGNVLLALQVILGYVLLGALVTRVAVLFTAGGPAGKFTDEKSG